MRSELLGKVSTNILTPNIGKAVSLVTGVGIVLLVLQSFQPDRVEIVDAPSQVDVHLLDNCTRMQVLVYR